MAVRFAWTQLFTTVFLWPMFFHSVVLSETIDKTVIFNKFETITEENVINFGSIYRPATECTNVEMNKLLQVERSSSDCLVTVLGALDVDVTIPVKVTSNITVNLHVKVINISRIVETNSASVTITGLKLEDFLDKLDEFRTSVVSVIAEHFPTVTRIDQVQVLSVSADKIKTDSLHVVFSVCINCAINSFLNSTTLRVAVDLKSQVITGKLGANQTKATESSCSSATCTVGCRSVIAFNPKCQLGTPLLCPNMIPLVSSKITLVAVGLKQVAECVGEVVSGGDSCGPNTCLNGGHCNSNYNNDGVLCVCKNADFIGPRCQKLVLGFKNDGYAFLPPLPTINANGRLHISFKFAIGSASSSPILYSGSTSPDSYYGLKFYIKTIDGTTVVAELELSTSEGNNIILRVNPGGLVDARWHKIDILISEKTVTLMVDRCENADKACISKTTANFQRKLDFNKNPLQVGGIYGGSGIVSDTNLCMENLQVNGELYDFNVDHSLSTATNPRCQKRDTVCGITSTNIYGECGRNAVCNTKKFIGGRSCECSCKTYYRPVDIESTKTICDLTLQDKQVCTKKTSIRSLSGTDSYIKWELLPTFRDSNIVKNSIGVFFSFRTRAADGTLLALVNQDGSKYISLQLVNGEIFVRTDMISQQVTTSLKNKLNDGDWHRVKLSRIRKNWELDIDRLGGPANYFFHLEEQPAEFTPFFLSVGANFEFSKTTINMTSALSDSACFTDVRISDFYFPMTDIQNKYTAVVTASQNVAADCDDGENCPSGKNPCPPTKPVCANLWRSFSCGCTSGFVTVEDKCVPYDGCKLGQNALLCKNNATCKWETDKNTSVCVCLSGWYGPFCDSVEVPPTTTDPGKTAGAAGFEWYHGLIIGLFVLFIILFLLIGMVCARYRGGGEKQLLSTEFGDIDHIHESQVNYNDDGAGEEDFYGPLPPFPPPYTEDNPNFPIIDPYAIDDNPVDSPEVENVKPVNTAAPIIPGEGEEAPPGPADEPLTYQFEAEATPSENSAHLSPLNSLSVSEDGSLALDKLNDWGPQFQKLADLYGIQPRQ